VDRNVNGVGMVRSVESQLQSDQNISSRPLILFCLEIGR
jgi:hypothetical protein